MAAVADAIFLTSWISQSTAETLDLGQTPPAAWAVANPTITPLATVTTLKKVLVMDYGGSAGNALQTLPSFNAATTVSVLLYPHRNPNILGLGTDLQAQLFGLEDGALNGTWLTWRNNKTLAFCDFAGTTTYGALTTVIDALFPALYCLSIRASRGTGPFFVKAKLHKWNAGTNAWDDLLDEVTMLTPFNNWTHVRWGQITGGNYKMELGNFYMGALGAVVYPPLAPSIDADFATGMTVNDTRWGRQDTAQGNATGAGVTYDATHVYDAANPFGAVGSKIGYEVYAQSRRMVVTANTANNCTGTWVAAGAPTNGQAYTMWKDDATIGAANLEPPYIAEAPPVDTTVSTLRVTHTALATISQVYDHAVTLVPAGANVLAVQMTGRVKNDGTAVSVVGVYLAGSTFFGATKATGGVWCYIHATTSKNPGSQAAIAQADIDNVKLYHAALGVASRVNFSYCSQLLLYAAWGTEQTLPTINRKNASVVN